MGWSLRILLGAFALSLHIPYGSVVDWTSFDKWMTHVQVLDAMFLSRGQLLVLSQVVPPDQSWTIDLISTTVIWIGLRS